MMKKTIQFVPIIAIAMAGTMSSCVDSGKDLYDPSYETPNGSVVILGGWINIC